MNRKINDIARVMTTDKLEIDTITGIFFSIFNNPKQQQADWSLCYRVCIPEIIIIKKEAATEIIYSLDSFIEPRKKILSDGTLKEFEESETAGERKIIGNLAQRFSTYHKSGYLNGKHFTGSGNKFFQFIKTNDGWKISSLVWEDESM